MRSIAVIVIALAATGCAVDDPLQTSPDSRPTAGCRLDDAPIGTTTIDFALDDDSRRHLRTVPSAAASGSPLPLVLSYHGYASSPADIHESTGLPALGEAENFIVVSPAGAGSPTIHNIETIESPALADDVAYTEALLGHLGRTLCIDAARIYATGVSNGGLFAATLACHLPDEIAAVASVAGTHLPAGCRGVTPLLIIHGTADPVIPFRGEGPDTVSVVESMGVEAAGDDRAMFAASRRPIDEWAAAWAAHNGCRGEPAVERREPDVSIASYGRCSDGASVVQITVEGGGHTWPGEQTSGWIAENLGAGTTTIDGATTVWEFFSSR